LIKIASDTCSSKVGEQAINYANAAQKVGEWRILNIFPSLYPLVCRFQNNNDVEMEVVIAKYLSRCDGRGALKIPSFYTHYEVNVNLIRIMFGF
jgi:hypothetical protein